MSDHSKDNITVCFFGGYRPEYARNRVLLKGLSENDCTILECRSTKKGIRKYIDLFKQHKALKDKYDILHVAYPGWHAVLLAKCISRKPIVFDMLYSIYDSAVCDRQNTSKWSIKALYFWFMDWSASMLADTILLDTHAHIAYVSSSFRISRKKCERVLVGSDLRSSEEGGEEHKGNKTKILFWGYDIPLQGTKYILQAAEILHDRDDISFTILGEKLRKRYQNGYPHISFPGEVHYTELPQWVETHDICLGIFGNTPKTKRVIPNKVYEAVACGKPVITADTPAIHELFTEKDLMLVPASDAQAIADTIVFLRDNPTERTKIAQNGYTTFQEKVIPQKIGKHLKEIYVRVLKHTDA